jgi:single-strand DNA-binding protein
VNETLVTVVGNVATEPESQVSAAGVPFTRFRLASTARRYDPERGGWSDGSTSFFTVRAWRALALNIKESVGLGEPLVVQGRLRIREDDREGRRSAYVDIDAVAVGHDLARGVTTFRRVHAGSGGSGAAATTPDPRPAVAPPPEPTAVP